MKTFFSQFVFIAAMFGFAVSASADVAVLDWDNTGSALVFAQEISTLNNDDHRNVTIDYALKDNILYSRIQFDPTQYQGDGYSPGDFEFMTKLGATNMRFFGGNEKAEVEELFNGKRGNFRSDQNIWQQFKTAIKEHGAITATFSAFTSFYDDDDTTQKSTFFDSTRLDSSNYDLEKYYKDSINDLYYNTAGEGEFLEGPVPEFERAASAFFAVNEKGEITHRNGAATDSFAFYGVAEEELDSVAKLGLTTNYTYNYIDGWLQVFADDDFLFMVSNDIATGTLQYAVNVASLGLENYSGIHVGSEIEDYYTYLSFDQGVVAATPEPATALILGFAGAFALPFLRRKRK
jgi:hypothetical protein